MDKRKIARIALLAAILIGSVMALRLRSSDVGVYKFRGIEGPAAPSLVPQTPGARPSDFSGGSIDRLAVLVTDSSSGWLGLARGLKAHGIPFSMTTNVHEALRHKVVFAYPIISGALLKAADFEALRAHVADGGSLLTFDLEGGGLDDVFGVAHAPVGEKADVMSWVGPSPTGGERTIRVSRTGSEAQLGVVGYEATTARTLATFDGGRAALTCRSDRGTACALGVDLGALTARSMNGREEAVARSYVNGYEPSVDELYRWLAKFYVDGEPMPWLIDTAPAGRDLTILLTHDIDFTYAVSSAATYAKALAKVGANATFFMQTKYVRDFNDDVFFNASTLPSVKAVLGAGMEVGSHSVSHSNAMKRFPLGDGREAYPSYRPFVETRERTREGTILGELRVSRFLLKGLTAAHVDSFRAGYLSNPFKLPQALAASGYRYDSSITANSCLTHLPFQLTRDRADRSLEPVWEFPVTIEDEAKPALVSRFDAADAVIGSIARNHGLAVVLVHPDDATRKLEFERRIVAAWRGRAWFASMASFGEWWTARDQADVDVQQANGRWTLRAGGARALHGLVVRLPKWKPAGSAPAPRGMRFGPHSVVLDTSIGSVSAAL